MKITVLSNCPLVESQGSGYVILNYARELRERGHEVECLGPESYEFLPRLRRARLWRLSIGAALLVLRRRLFRGRDLVECCGGETWLAVLLMCALRGRPVLVHHSNGLEPRISRELVAHGGSDSHSGAPRRWYQWRGHRLLEQAYRRVDALVLVSDIEARFARACRYQPDDRILALETPLPAGFGALPIGPRPVPAVGFCGAWIARKGVAVMRAAFTELLRSEPSLEVRLVGVGPGFDRHAEFPPDVAGRVQVVPFVADKAALRDWYGGISVFVLPSLSESFGLVVTEAMACGCAVVASKTGFAASLVDGEEAIVIDSFDPAAYVHAVRTLLADEALRARIAAAGQRRVQGLRWADAGARLERFYRDLPRRRSGAVPVRGPA